MIIERTPRAQCVDVDLYGPPVCYLRTHAYRDLEREARAARRGLWADPAPAPPWEFRRTEHPEHVN
jgi:endonuclease YncB( thermonuclease family)